MFANFAIGWRDVQCQGIVSEIQILDSIESAGMKDGAMIFVVSNPVDILTYLAIERLDLPVNKVVGLGTVLDTVRFRSFIANDLKLAKVKDQ